MTNTAPSTTRSPKKPKIVIWILLAITIVAAIIGYFVAQNNSTAAIPAATESAMEGQLVRENSLVLSQAPNEKAVLVEFLDFECEACGAAYPFVEELRAEYSDNVTFVQQYFPLPGHLKSMNAAGADSVTEERVKLAIADGTALGARGTPTFFLDGKMLVVQTLEQFRAAVEATAAN